MEKEKLILKTYDEIYETINSKYPILKPKLKIVKRKWENKLGDMVTGYYPRIHFTLSVNLNHDINMIKNAIIHELCHVVNSIHFPQKTKRKISHNKQFWKLTKEFKYKPYYMTTAMK